VPGWGSACGSVEGVARCRPVGSLSCPCRSGCLVLVISLERKRQLSSLAPWAWARDAVPKPGGVRWGVSEPVGAENSVRPAEAAIRDSWMRPPRRSLRSLAGFPFPDRLRAGRTARTPRGPTTRRPAALPWRWAGHQDRSAPRAGVQLPSARLASASSSSRRIAEVSAGSTPAKSGSVMMTTLPPPGRGTARM